MSELKICLANYEDQVINSDDIITCDTDVLSLFPNEFMKQYTEFETLIDFISASGKDFNSQDSWNSIQNGDIDSFICSHSEFKSWVDMYTTAGDEFLKNRFI